MGGELDSKNNPNKTVNAIFMQTYDPSVVVAC